MRTVNAAWVLPAALLPEDAGKHLQGFQPVQTSDGGDASLDL